MRSSSASYGITDRSNDNNAAAASGTGVTGMIAPMRPIISRARRSSSARRRSLGQVSTPSGAVASHARRDNGAPKFTAARP